MEIKELLLHPTPYQQGARIATPPTPMKHFGFLEEQLLVFVHKLLIELDGFVNDLWKFDGQYWTWISGSNSINQEGVYGVKGVPSASNIPGARWEAAMEIDSQNNIWIFGGLYESTSSLYIHRYVINS